MRTVKRTALKAVTRAKSESTLERLLSLHPKLVDLSLGRMERLLAALGNPERALPPVVHVTGTNGKGSTLAFLRAILEAAGLRVHVYTSPHLVHFHERIRLAGKLIDEAYLQEMLAECEIANDGLPITFFEITTAAAFIAFSRVPADIVLLENGLGGRLDATNVLPKPALTGITPVSLDHQQFLGDTLAKITTEKAGIIKPGVPCVVGPQRPEVMDVIVGHTDAKEAPLIECGVNWRAHEEAGQIILEHHGEQLILPKPALTGAHQIMNAAQAAVMARSLSEFDISTAHIEAGFCAVEWPARMQQLRRGPIIDAVPESWDVWLDGGHNPAAGEIIADHARAVWQDQPLHLVVGMINSKEPEGYFRAFSEIVASVHCVTIPDEAAAIQAADLRDIALSVGLKANVADDALSAVKKIAEDQSKSSRILICGSLYFAGKILKDHQ